jgi:hypothetical protein
VDQEKIFTFSSLLGATVDTDRFPDPPKELSGQIAIYTSRPFLWPAVRNANPAFVFDPVSINILKAKNITFEAVFSGNGEHWIGRP